MIETCPWCDLPWYFPLLYGHKRGCPCLAWLLITRAAWDWEPHLALTASPASESEREVTDMGKGSGTTTTRTGNDPKGDLDKILGRPTPKNK